MLKTVKTTYRFTDSSRGEIKAALASRGLTQADLADSAGITRSAISQALSGLQPVSDTVLRAIVALIPDFARQHFPDHYLINTGATQSQAPE
jgi:transcriptional regulator with XRE-family HTH domain